MANYFVDPVAGNDTTGDGAIGTPWKTVQKALNTITRDTDNGDKINLKAGSADVLTAALNLTTYGTPNAQAPLIIRGYTTAVDDGGVGELSGGDSVGIYAAAATIHVRLIDLVLGNCGSSRIWDMGAGFLSAYNCTFRGSTAGQAVTIGHGVMMRCRFHTLSGETPVSAGNNPSRIQYCILDATPTEDLVNIGGDSSIFTHNLVINRGAPWRLVSAPFVRQIIAHNIFVEANLTGSRVTIDANNALTRVDSDIYNNIFYGLYLGVRTLNSGRPGMVGSNAFFNVSQHYSLGKEPLLDIRANDVTLTANPFVDAAGGDYNLTSAAQALLVAQGWPATWLGGSWAPQVAIGAQQYGGAGGLVLEGQQTGDVIALNWYAG